MSGGEHVIQATETNVVSPSITTHDPDTLLDQVVSDGVQLHEFILCLIFEEFL